ncbi:MAG: hypothetical protein V1918_07365, partial [Planctomycetota bacterium]
MEMHAPSLSAFVNASDRKVTARLLHAKGEETIAPEGDAASPDFHRFYGYFGENRHFIDCVQSGAMPSSSIQDAVKTMELVDRIRDGGCT